MATVRKNKKKKIITAAIIVAVIAAVVAGIVVYTVQGAVPEVKLYTVGTSDIFETVNATGKVSSGAVKDYKIGAVATVKEVKVKVGDEVKKGDLLATFDTSNLDSQVAQMQSSYSQAKASYNESLDAQKDAKKNLAAVQKKIAELEKENKKLQKKASTTTTTAKKTTSTTRISSTGSTGTTASTSSPTLPSLTMPSFSVNTSNPAVELPTNIQINPDLIAGIDINDMSSVMAAVSSTESALKANEIMLAAYYAQEQMYSSLASDSIVQVKKDMVNTTKSALNSLQEAQQEMAAGWKAAFDGTITECNLFPDEQTSLLSTGITLQNMNNMVVTISLGEYDIHKVKTDMSAKIKTAYGEYAGKVISIAPVASGGGGSSILDSMGSSMGISGLSSLTDSGAGVEVQISVENPDENIIVGFDANVEISVGDYVGVVTVPFESLVYDKTGTYVYLYDTENKTVTKTLIETGAKSYTEYQVTEGIKLGDQIVQAPDSSFEDSFEVKIAEGNTQ